MEMSCLELALKGERQCKVGDYHAGVSFFESAIQVGTEDLQILSAIYSQLGNAYFHLQEYSKALEYHCHDLTLTRTIGDELGEAKASGNLGNTLKVLGRFDEAVVCCQRHYDITRGMYDKVGQARALYNFGNVYYSKGKSICWTGAEPGEIPEEAKFALVKATEYYELNLSIVKDLEDRAAQGRTYGNLGNAYYLLGNFQKTVGAHEQRLLIAKEFGDRAAERRAYCNLGNAYIFLGQFGVAAEHYKRTLQLARLLKDKAVEAQACYSLGNTYTLLRDYERAIDYHLKHLIIARELKDRVGEGRACWSLGNAHTALGNHQDAVHFAEKHLEISKEVYCLVNVYSTSLFNSRPPSACHVSTNVPGWHFVTYASSNAFPVRAFLILFTGGRSSSTCDFSSLNFVFIIKIILLWQRRCSFQAKLKLLLPFPLSIITPSSPLCPLLPQVTTSVCEANLEPGHFLDLLATSQGRRLDEQRASVGSSFPGLRLCSSNHSLSPPTTRSPLMTSTDQPQADDVFFDMLVKCQGSRLNDQRSTVPPLPTSTVPDEDFLSLILRSQANRMDEQRVPLPLPPSSDAVPSQPCQDCPD
uniref:G-protein-signaling modulator 2 n=1 Tax=Oncorhynchus mykiss TaxID=8022 RepID=A0A8L0DW51_ONCMY